VHLLQPLIYTQFQNIHTEKQQISVGFIGYPNVGKSSVINTLKTRKVCNVAPIPGETKVWQYISLFKKIFLIDCPGVVHPSPDESEIDIVLKGVIRTENLKTPSEFIPAILERTKKEYIQRTYNIMEWDGHEDFLEKYAKFTGKLLKKGEPDIETVSKMVINDWMRGKIPYFVPPPDMEIVEEKDGNTKNKIEVPNQNVHSIRIKENFFDDVDQPPNESMQGIQKDKSYSDEQDDIDEDVDFDDLIPQEEDQNDNEDQIQQDDDQDENNQSNEPQDD